MPCRRLLLGAIGTPVSRMCSISELICINPNKSVPLWLFSASHPLHAFPFHSIASGPGKRHPKQIKKNNLAKRASALAALQASKPSPIVSGPSAFLDSLARPTPPTDPAVPPPQGSAWQYLLTAEEEQFLFMDTPLIVAELAADGSNSTVEREREKAGVVKRIVGLGNASAKAVGVWNVRRAVEYFGRKVGDTGNSEVQGGRHPYRPHPEPQQAPRATPQGSAQLPPAPLHGPPARERAPLPQAERPQPVLYVSEGTRARTEGC
ncbi:hypothetical protein BC938DRAFT_471638 [Jimgerdemannia flammicorona]|uniref:Uncharacterized protein n=1 Tax=Jimgerdemannia flammicorona TaxID=994334 RepID=A0A433R075_9FUNG|nr:hypothetical protein BC938DRAFT_471638 [Jimgerdemannia flammicorona]